MKTCSIEGCTGVFYGGGLCKSHWMSDYRKMRYAIDKGQPVKDTRYAEREWAWIKKYLGIVGADYRVKGF